MYHTYLFETRGIQSFLFATGKLRDLLKGSELLDYVCAEGGYLDQMLKALGLQPCSVPRRAGATFYLVFDKENDARRFRDAWRLGFTQWVPGVESVDTLASDTSIRKAIGNGIRDLALRRNVLKPVVPGAGPLTELAQRTGVAATAKDKSESIDAVTARLRRFERPADGLTLEKRFLDQEGYVWPRNFEENSAPKERFPLQRNRLIGVIHADGNGIGQVLRTLNDATKDAADDVYEAVYRAFSEGLSQVTQAAAQHASREVLLPAAGQNNVLPARPLVLGGDDMSILVRADLTMAYLRIFVAQFAEESMHIMQQLKQLLRDRGLSTGADVLPERLTASAGVCYVKCNFPFQSAYVLAESLCKRAKNEARQHMAAGTPPPATVAFHKMEGAIAEDADILYQQFHCVKDRGRSYRMALGAYAFDEVHGMPLLKNLEELADVFANGKVNDRQLRSLATVWHQDVTVASQAYERWRQLNKRQALGDLNRFDAALGKLIGPQAGSLPANDHGQSVLSDLLVWLSIHARSGSSTAEARA